MAWRKFASIAGHPATPINASKALARHWPAILPAAVGRVIMECVRRQGRIKANPASVGWDHRVMRHTRSTATVRSSVASDRLIDWRERRE